MVRRWPVLQVREDEITCTRIMMLAFRIQYQMLWKLWKKNADTIVVIDPTVDIHEVSDSQQIWCTSFVFWIFQTQSKTLSSFPLVFLFSNLCLMILSFLFKNVKNLFVWTRVRVCFDLDFVFFKKKSCNF